MDIDPKDLIIDIFRTGVSIRHKPTGVTVVHLDKSQTAETNRLMALDKLKRRLGVKND